MEVFMSLGDFLKKAGTAAINSLQEKNAKIEHQKDRYEHYDTDKLIRMYKTSYLTSDEKLAIIQILNERGYTRGDLED